MSLVGGKIAVVSLVAVLVVEAWRTLFRGDDDHIFAMQSQPNVCDRNKIIVRPVLGYLLEAVSGAEECPCIGQQASKRRVFWNEIPIFLNVA